MRHTNARLEKSGRIPLIDVKHQYRKRAQRLVAPKGSAARSSSQRSQFIKQLIAQVRAAHDRGLVEYTNKVGAFGRVRVIWGFKGHRAQEATEEVVLGRPKLLTGYLKAQVGNAGRIQLKSAPVSKEEFLPSTELLGFWKRGIDAHRREAQRPGHADRHEQFYSSQEHQDYLRAFSVRFKRMLIVMAQRQSYGVDDFSVLAESGGLSISFSSQLQDRIEIRPDEISEFFACVYSELRNYLEQGGVLGGKWGSLELQNGNIYLRSNVPERNPDDWGPAQAFDI